MVTQTFAAGRGVLAPRFCQNWKCKCVLFPMTSRKQNSTGEKEVLIKPECLLHCKLSSAQTLPQSPALGSLESLA
jgi:hypothetical protein